MRSTIKRTVPKKILRARQIRMERRALRSIPSSRCDAVDLRSAADLQLVTRALNSESLLTGWEKLQASGAVAIPDGTGGVNPGDRRAIYSLVALLQPRRVLEIGTHVGASTTSIAAALSDLIEVDGYEDRALTTVDINDVNDAGEKPWIRHGTQISPLEMLERLGYAELVRFVTVDSVKYFAEIDESFDLVFLDGSHAAITVYQEIAAALRLVNGGGAILLHDFFPDMRPLWSSGSVIVGPWLAVERLISEGAPLEAVPVGDLPWPTKLGSHRSSLALLGKSQ